MLERVGRQVCRASGTETGITQRCGTFRNVAYWERQSGYLSRVRYGTAENAGGASAPMLNDFTGADKVYIACGYTDLRIHSIPKPVVFGLEIGTERAYYFFMLVILVCVLFCIHRILNSKIGRAWIAIRENPDAARSLGVEILKYKSYNFMVMGFILGLGGSLMAYYYRYISPEMFQIDQWSPSSCYGYSGRSWQSGWSAGRLRHPFNVYGTAPL